ncbi:alpha-actinin-1 [Ixodes scapularis]|uniref:alpha-actinin-1 n=1 Tax=Ixodes scapularis TaxID=6945 RepID=UPI001C385293|nr:alpha-actinin-1 [Ixodes scapularis]
MGGGEAGEMASWQKQQKELHQQQRDLEQQQQRRLQQQLASTHVLRQSSTDGVPVPNQVHVPPAATTPNVWSPRGAPPQSAANVSRDTRHQHPPSKAPPPVHPRPARVPVQTAQPVMQPPPQMQQTSPQVQRHMQPSPKMPSSPQMQRMQPMQQQQPNQPTQTMTTVTTTRRVPLDVVPQPSGQRVWTEQPVSEYQDPGAPSTAQVIAAQSQDYVDEKELEYRMAIQQLQDEQERVQKKVFMNWINNFLSQRNPPLRVDDVIQDLRDGTKLLALLEILSGQVLPRERARILRRPHFLSNVNTVLRFLEQRRIKLVNINATDVVDGKPAILLGLIWTIILHFQIEEHTRLLAGSPAGWEDAGSDIAAAEQNVLVQASPKRPTPIERWRGGARKALLHWVKNSINQRFGVQVNDFGPSWRDGLAFLAIVHCIQPSLIELDSVKKMEPRGRLETAFSLAHRELGIPRLLDPEDVDVPQPDERSVMTYVAQFLHKYPGTYAPEQPLSPTLASPTAAAPPGMQPDDLSVLESFLKRAEDTLLVLNRPLTNVREEYLVRRRWGSVRSADYR